MSTTVLRIGGTPAAEFRLLPIGTLHAPDAVRGGGSYAITRDMLTPLVDWFGALGRRLLVDYEHQAMGLTPRPDGLSPAAGWIGGLELRADGLWATNVEWTAKATTLIASGEYQYYSPVIYWADETHTAIDALGPVALTNDPSMHGVHALAATRRRVTAATGDKMASMETIAQLVGLSPGATAEQVVAAINESNAGPVALALGLSETATADEVRKAVTQMGQQADAKGKLADAGKSAAAPEGTVSVEEHAKAVARIAELERRDADSVFRTICTSGAGKGKITPTMEMSMRRLFDADRAAFDKLVAELPVLAGEESVFTAGKARSVTREEEDFDKSDKLKKEFGDKDTYQAYQRNAARVTIV